jgi:hypothetical protein
MYIISSRGDTKSKLLVGLPILQDLVRTGPIYVYSVTRAKENFFFLDHPRSKDHLNPMDYNNSK